MLKFIDEKGLQNLSIEEVMGKHKQLLQDFPGQFEDESQTRSRFEYELVASKEKLEKHIGKRIEHFAWPNGGYCEQAYKLASQTYKSFQMPSNKIKNRRTDSPQYYYRIGAPQSSKTEQERKLRLQKLILKMDISRGLWHLAVPFWLVRLKLDRLSKSTSNKHLKYNFDLIQKTNQI